MKYINIKTLALILLASVMLGLTGCGSEGTVSDTQLIGTASSAPIATPQNIIVYENTKTTPVITEGTDADGDTLTYTVTTQPANGVLTGTAPNLIYTPETDYTGYDSFEFIVNDGTDDSEAATVTITVVAKPKLNIGYYDLELDDGSPNQIQPIDTSDNNATNVGPLANADLSKYDILFVQNPSNSDYAATYLNNLSAIADYVSNGGILIFHDRYVTEANISIPGGEAIVFERNTTDNAYNITILLDNTLLTDGSGGVLTDDSLDNGTKSSHGFAAAISVPVDTVGLLSRDNVEELVTFQYPYGDGYVIYSTIPLDYYLAGSGAAEFRDIYAPNIIDYSVELFLLK